MALPPPAALGAGKAGRRLLIVPVSSRVSAGVVGLPRARRTAGRSVLRCPLGAEAKGCGEPLGPGRGRQPPQPSSGASSEGCGVLSRLPPCSRGCVCLRRGGGAGALCAQPPFPRGCWSRGSRRLRRDPSWLRHSWSATGLLRTYQLLLFKTARLPGRSRGGRGCLGLFPMEA